MRQVFITFHSVSSKTQTIKFSEFSLSEWEKEDFPTAEGKLWSITALHWLEMGDDKGGREIKHMDKKTNTMVGRFVSGACQTVSAPAIGKL